MTCRTLHPDPQRLLTLGEAARAAGVSHLALRRAVQDGSLATLPALHLGQRIRLVEPEALLAAYPDAACEDRPPLDPDHRGIEWIGATAQDEPPQAAPSEGLAAPEEPPYELPRAAAAVAGDRVPSNPAQAPSAAGAPSSPAASTPVDGLDGLVSADFGGRPTGAGAAVQAVKLQEPSSSVGSESRGAAVLPAPILAVEPEGAQGLVTAEPSNTAEPDVTAEPSNTAEPSVTADPAAPDATSSEPSSASSPEQAPTPRPTPAPDTPLTESVERWESGQRRRARIVQGALTAWAVLLVAAWLQFEAEVGGQVQAAGLGGGGVELRSAPKGSEGPAQQPEASAPGATVGAQREGDAAVASPSAVVSVEGTLAGGPGPEGSGSEGPGSEAPAPETSAAEASGTEPVAPPLEAGSAPGVLATDTSSASNPPSQEVDSSSAPDAVLAAAAVEATPRKVDDSGGDSPPAPAAPSEQEVAPLYTAHRETPRFAGTPCAWWEMTRPGGDLRRVLGPCKGPFDEEEGAIVGVHRQGSQNLCSHHLRFVRDLGGDLEAELASAAAAREGGLPAPLLAMRIDGAARAMVRERVGRWVQSGFEGGEGHRLEALGGDSWRVRTWVVAAPEGEEPRRMEVEMVLTLGDGPHDDTLQSFRFPRSR